MRTTIFQLVVPDAYRGRIYGLMVTTGVGAEALGMPIVPILAAAFGLALVTNVLAMATLIATALALGLIGASADRNVNVRPAAGP